jgi:hypothetical protein
LSQKGHTHACGRENEEERRHTYAMAQAMSCARLTRMAQGMLWR